jgi:hypothetical protein
MLSFQGKGAGDFMSANQKMLLQASRGIAACFVLLFHLAWCKIHRVCPFPKVVVSKDAAVMIILN